MLDLIIREGWVVTKAGVQNLDIGILEGKITALESGISESAKEIIDASGLHVFPGVIDAHVHFNEPGRADWEGLETGSKALAAGGGTLFFDMPLNAHPPTIDAASFDLKHRAATANSVVDFALWGGLVPGNVDKMDELARRGVVGFKAFMSNSGIEDFACVDDKTLREGMKRAEQLRRIIAVHAESDALTQMLAEESIKAGNTSIRDYLDSRPIAAELEAIRRALALAGETRCPLHIVHVSSGAGVALIVEARKAGVNVTCETCPHYLVMTEEDVLRIGALAKCAPPLRPAAEQEHLWKCVAAREVQTIGSDHSPSPLEMKRDENFFKVWGGISGAQHTLPLLCTEGFLKRKVPLPLLSQLLSENPARRFGLPPEKGGFQIDGDADMALLDLREVFPVRTAELFYRHKQSPYVGRELHGRMMRTLVRGKTVFHNGKIVAKPLGKLVKPDF